MSTGDPNITSPSPGPVVIYSTLFASTVLSSTTKSLSSPSTVNVTQRTNFVTTEPGPNISSVMEPCQAFEYVFDQDIGLSVVCGLCFFIGLVLAFTGYRLFKVTMFIQSMSLTAVLSYLVLIQRTSLGTLWNGVIAGGIGVVFGIMAALINTVGLIGCSLIQGLFVSVAVLFVVGFFISLEVIWIPVGVIGGVSVLLTTLCLIWQRSVAILYITSYSAILVMVSVDYYLDLFLLTKYAYSKILLIPQRKPCWFSWTVFALWPFFMILGSCVQFLKTGKDFNHRKVKRKMKKSKENTRHRRLYDNGDVIAQAWIQTTEDTLEKRRSGTPNFDSYPEDDEEHTTLV